MQKYLYIGKQLDKMFVNMDKEHRKVSNWVEISTFREQGESFSVLEKNVYLLDLWEELERMNGIEFPGIVINNNMSLSII